MERLKHLCARLGTAYSVMSAQILAVRTEFPRCNFVVPLQAPGGARGKRSEHDDSNKYGSCRSRGCVSFGADDYGEARHIGSRSEQRCCGAEEARSVERARHVYAADCSNSRQGQSGACGRLLCTIVGLRRGGVLHRERGFARAAASFRVGL